MMSDKPTPRQIPASNQNLKAVGSLNTDQVRVGGNARGLGFATCRNHTSRRRLFMLSQKSPGQCIAYSPTWNPASWATRSLDYSGSAGSERTWLDVHSTRGAVGKRLKIPFSSRFW